MNRRGFIRSILAAAVAPAIVRAEVLMPVLSLWTPLTGSEILARQDEFYGIVSPLATQDLSSLAKKWSRAVYRETLKSRTMMRFIEGSQWSEAEMRVIQARSAIIHNTIPPFEQKPTPGRDVATLPSLPSKGPFI